MWQQVSLFTALKNACQYSLINRTIGKGGPGGARPLSPTISWSKSFFPCKIFTGEEYMRLEVIYCKRHK